MSHRYSVPRDETTGSCGEVTRRNFNWNFIRSTFSLTGNGSFAWQMLVHTQLLTHRTNGDVHWKATFFTGHRIWCVSYPRIHLLQNIRLLVLPTPTIEAWRLFVSAVSIARFPKLPAMHFIMLWSLCILEPRDRKRRWDDSSGFFKEFISITIIFGVTVVWQHLKGPQIDGPQWHILWCFGIFFLATSNTFSFLCRFWRSSFNVGLASAIRSDVTNASTAETFFVGSTLPSTFRVAFARIVPGFGENLLAVSDL